ncbi:hypothetical protein ACFLTH_10440 [Bacteroidota bacterium]
MFNLLTLLIIIGIPSFFLIQKNPDFFFWFGLMMFFDPGGYVEGYLGGNLLGLLNVTDVFFVVMMTCLISVKNKINPFKTDKDFKKIFFYLLWFHLFFIIIYGLIIPIYNGRLDFVFFLVKSREYFMALPIMYAVYIFAHRNFALFFNIFIYISALVLILYFVTLTTGVELIPVWRFDRYSGYDYQRISLWNYGLIHWVLNLGIIAFFLFLKKKKAIPKINLLYLSAVLMAVTLLITLTRREYLYIGFSVIVISIVLWYLFRMSKLKIYFKTILPAFIVLFFLVLLIPQSFEGVGRIFQDTFSIILTGQDTRGVTDYRIAGTGDLEIARSMISENLFWGTGYLPYTWAEVVRMKLAGDPFAAAIDASGEIPLYGILFRMGLIGFLLGSFIFIAVIKIIIKLLKHIKRNPVPQSNLEFLFILFLLVELMIGFTFNLYSTYGAFFSPIKMVIIALKLSFLFALKNILIDEK